MLIHLGYLGCDSEREEAFIPNKESHREFINTMSTGGWQAVIYVLKDSEKLLEDTLGGGEKILIETERTI